MLSVASVILSLFLSHVSALAALNAAPYKEFDLATLCKRIQTKQSLYLHNQAHRFIFNSSNTELIKCHLELHLHSNKFGFSIFINSMNLDDRQDCGSDFLQFGRWILYFQNYDYFTSKHIFCLLYEYCKHMTNDKCINFIKTTLCKKNLISCKISIMSHLKRSYICDTFLYCRDFIVFTSHKSDKKCGTIKPLDGLTFTSDNERLKALKAREYIEAEDMEMDIWLSIKPPPYGQPNKQLSFTVTPFKKKCSDNDSYYRKCPGSQRCIKHELFCDGLVNCDGDPKDEQEEYCLINSSISNVDMFLSIPIIILIVIFVILGIMFIIFMIRLLYVTLRSKNSQQHPHSGEAERRALHDVSSVSSSPRYHQDPTSHGLIDLQSRYTFAACIYMSEVSYYKLWPDLVTYMKC